MRLSTRLQGESYKFKVKVLNVILKMFSGGPGMAHPATFSAMVG